MKTHTSPSSNGMTGSGRVAVGGTFFHRAFVRAVEPQGGRTPTITIRHGRHPGGPAIASIEATLGAEINLDPPEWCPEGIYLDVGGEPASIDVVVQFA